MKKVVILFVSLLFGMILNAQIAYSDIEDDIQNVIDYNSFDVGEIADDTVYWFDLKNDDPVLITVNFTYLSADDATLDIYKGIHKRDSVTFCSVDGLLSLTLPVTLVKAAYAKTYESVSVSSISFMQDYWTEDLLGIKLDPSDGTTGTIEVFISR